MDYSGFGLSATSFVEHLPSSLSEMKKQVDWPNWKIAVREGIEALVLAENYRKSCTDYLPVGVLAVARRLTPQLRN